MIAKQLANLRTNKLTEGWGISGNDYTLRKNAYIYIATERDKTRGTTGILLTSGEIKSLDLTIKGSIHTAITKTTNYCHYYDYLYLSYL